MSWEDERLNDTNDKSAISTDAVPLQETRLSKRGLGISGAAFVFLVLVLPLAGSVSAEAAAPVPIGLLDPVTIPKFQNQLVGPPPVYDPEIVEDGDGNVVSHNYRVEMKSFYQQILPPPLPPTYVWGYSGNAVDAITGEPVWNVPDTHVLQNSPGPTFEAIKGIPINVQWVNSIDEYHMFAVDPTLHWADPMMLMENGLVNPPYPTTWPYYELAQTPVPLVTHLHGGEVPSASDGGPDAWFTSDGMNDPMYGPAYTPEEIAGFEPGSVTFHYPNTQPETTLWYHDHALGITRINVMSGLAGFYLLRNPLDPLLTYLPDRQYEMPIVIQDRTFKTDGSLFFDSAGINPEHPYWTPEFFGNTIMVNGLVWPNLNVDQGIYRFRLLDGSNARFYSLTFWDRANNIKLPFVQIGSDGGYLKSPAILKQLTLAPGERADILVDFRGLAPGTKILLSNSAKAPFPNGASPDPRTVGQIMQFTVTSGMQECPLPSLPAVLNQDLAGAFPSLPAATGRRTLVLNEVMGPGGPLELLLNGLKWAAPITESPVAGTTEEWVIVNPTADTHPIHLHLVQFQLVSRQRIDDQKYLADWLAKNGATMLPFHEGHEVQELDIAPYLKNKPKLAPPNEQGWKDTVQMNPGEVTIIRVRFAAIDGSGLTPWYYSFDPSAGPGYVWHCHIIDHEDNEMMRPYEVLLPAP